MTRYRRQLPQLGDAAFLSDGGLETTLIFHEGVDLPHFAAFTLLDTVEGREHLTRYYERYLNIARRSGVGFILDTPTWRANPDWAARLGYGPTELRRVNKDAVAYIADLRDRFETPATPCVLNGVIGPRGDGYRSRKTRTEEARTYHSLQIQALAEAGVDLVTALTINTIEEAAGIAFAAQDTSVPCALSFTVETDGRLVSGPTLHEAIEAVDRLTGASPCYYMINCAHPTHFMDAFAQEGPWIERIRGLRANASTRSHAELDEAETLDEGDPQDLGRHYAGLLRRIPSLRILGGCCGTDHRHVGAICEAVLGPEAEPERRLATA